MWVDAARAEVGKACGARSLRQPSTVRVQNETMVGVGRRRKIQQRLEKPLDRNGVAKVLAAEHMTDLLRGVVDHHREMVGDANPLSSHDHIAGRR